MDSLRLSREQPATLSPADVGAATEAAAQYHPAMLAEFGESLPVPETWHWLAQLPVDRQATVFPFFSRRKQEELARGADRTQLAPLLEAMSHDERVDLLKRIDRGVVTDLLPLLPAEDREDILTLSAYREHTAGSLMTTDFVSLPSDLTVADAIVLLRGQVRSRETVYYLYVVDSERRLLGLVSLRDLVFAEAGATIGELMNRDVISVDTQQDREEVVRTLAKYDFLAIPVTDDQQRLVGIVTYDDALDVVVEEATEDLLRQGSVGAMDENYLELPFATVWRKRSLWLSCLFVAELLTFTAMAHFQDALGAVLALSLFVPLCISTGGNSGSQAATLVTRALALGQVRPNAWWQILRYELAMGALLGITLGVVGFIRVVLTPQSVLGSVDRATLAIVIGQAIAGICLWGTLVGGMLPLAFRRLGIDPGYASSPFVATFVDVTGIIIYFSIATAYLL